MTGIKVTLFEENLVLLRDCKPGFFLTEGGVLGFKPTRARKEYEKPYAHILAYPIASPPIPLPMTLKNFLDWNKPITNGDILVREYKHKEF